MDLSYKYELSILDDFDKISYIYNICFTNKKILNTINIYISFQRDSLERNFIILFYIIQFSAL